MPFEVMIEEVTKHVVVVSSSNLLSSLLGFSPQYSNMFLLVQHNHYLMGIIDWFCDSGSIVSFLSEEKDKLEVEERSGRSMNNCEAEGKACQSGNKVDRGTIVH